MLLGERRLLVFSSFHHCEDRGSTLHYTSLHYASRAHSRGRKRLRFLTGFYKSPSHFHALKRTGGGGGRSFLGVSALFCVSPTNNKTDTSALKGQLATFRFLCVFFFLRAFVGPQVWVCARALLHLMRCIRRFIYLSICLIYSFERNCFQTFRPRCFYVSSQQPYPCLFVELGRCFCFVVLTVYSGLLQKTDWMRK